LKLRKREEFKHTYTTEFQKHILAHLISDADTFARCRRILKDEYFDDQLAPTVRFVLAHADAYHTVPHVDLIKAKTGLQLTTYSPEVVQQQTAWFLAEFESFCKDRAVENVAYAAVDMLQAGERDEVARRMKEAVTISLISELGTDYFSNPKERLERLVSKDQRVSTGWKALDDVLYGGFTRGGLQLFLGNSGAGKSLVLQNLALNWALAGYSGVYFSLELAEDEICLKLDAMVTGMGTRAVVKSIDDVSFAVIMKGKNAGKLKIKRLPENGTNVNDLEAYLKEYEISLGGKPDFIIVDYLDLMVPISKIDLSNLFVKDKFVSEELRALMHRMNVFGATAGQLNRCVSPDTIVFEEQRGWTKVANLHEGDRIAGSSGFVSVKHVFPTSRQRAYTIKTKQGNVITCSGNHRFPTSRGLLSINDGMSVGDILNTSDRYSGQSDDWQTTQTSS
jgi:archaellum biogenesis ATPase FlaH